VVSKVDKLVPYAFNNCNIFDQDIYNDPFIFVVLFKLVNPLTFNEDNNETLLFNVVKPLTFNDDTKLLLLMLFYSKL
jgi:hypothetical protein